MYDWYMLAFPLAAEVHNDDRKGKLVQDSFSSASKVVAAVKEVQRESLLHLLQEIVRAEVL